MPRYAVSAIDFSDNELMTEIITADTMAKAMQQSKHVTQCVSDRDLFPRKEENESEYLERIKNEAFDCDGMINVVLIPDPAPAQPDTSAPPYPRNTLL